MTTYRTIDGMDIYNMITDLLTNQGVAQRTTRTQLGGTKEQFTINLTDIPVEVHGDRITPLILVTNSYNRESALTISVGAYRWVCSNGLYDGVQFFHERIIHRIGETTEQRLTNLPKHINDAITYCKNQFADDIQTATDIEVSSHRQVLDIITHLNIPKRVKAGLLRQVTVDSWGVCTVFRPEDNPLTCWGLYNLVNEAVRVSKRSTPQSQRTHDTGLIDDISCLMQNSNTWRLAA